MFRLLFVLLIPFTLSAQPTRFEFTENKMGSPFRIVFYHTDSANARALSAKAFELVDTLNNIYSDYSSVSEVGQLADHSINRPIIVSDELFSMMIQCYNAWKASRKTFDVTIGALTRLWRKAKAENRFPSNEEIYKARQSVGFGHVTINMNSKTISFSQIGMSLDFGGIVKGYAAQRVVDFLKAHHVASALADAGGDIAVTGAPPGKNGWNIGINLPEQDELMTGRLEVSNVAVATSGDLYHFILHDGKKYSHIIDPRTGYGITSQRNVTIIANDGATADWLATACSILPVRKAKRLAKKFHAAVMIAFFKNNRLVVDSTSGFNQYFQQKIH